MPSVACKVVTSVGRANLSLLFKIGHPLLSGGGLYTIPARKWTYYNSKSHFATDCHQTIKLEIGSIANANHVQDTSFSAPLH